MAHDRPRLGGCFGLARRWVELAGSFVKIIGLFGSLAPPETGCSPSLLAPRFRRAGNASTPPTFTCCAVRLFPAEDVEDDE